MQFETWLKLLELHGDAVLQHSSWTGEVDKDLF